VNWKVVLSADAIADLNGLGTGSPRQQCAIRILKRITIDPMAGAKPTSGGLLLDGMEVAYPDPFYFRFLYTLQPNYNIHVLRLSVVAAQGPH
jgi:hypothetical protein